MDICPLVEVPTYKNWSVAMTQKLSASKKPYADKPPAHSSDNEEDLEEDLDGLSQQFFMQDLKEKW